MSSFLKDIRRMQPKDVENSHLTEISLSLSHKLLTKASAEVLVVTGACLLKSSSLSYRLLTKASAAKASAVVQVVTGACLLKSSSLSDQG